MLMTKGHHWLAGPMREVGTEMNEQTMEKLVMGARKETEEEHNNFVAERIKRRNEKLNEAHSTNCKYLHQYTDCNNEESRRIHHDELPRDFTRHSSRRGVRFSPGGMKERSRVTLTSRSVLDDSSRTS